MHYLIVGLGNIGEQYAMTPHNVGFAVLDVFAAQHEAVFSSVHLGSMATIKHRNQTLHLLKPSTYMNASGSAVRYWLHKLMCKQKNLLIITDDIHLPLGKLRLKPKGGNGGHNGLKDIAQHLQTQDYARLRFGVGNDFPSHRQRSYVLTPFTDEQQTAIDPAVQTSCQIITTFYTKGITFAMNHYNTTKPSPPQGLG